MSYLLPAIFLSSASGFLPESANRMFTVRSEAQQACGNQLCSAKELSSTLSGWFCPEYTATNPATHQRVFCNYDGSWVRSNAAPSDCVFQDKRRCQAAYNNCWNTPSSTCDYFCTCTNYESSTANRLGRQFGNLADDEQSRLGHYMEPVVFESLRGIIGRQGAATDYDRLDDEQPRLGRVFIHVGDDEQPRLGHSQRDQCPPYLPQAQSQLSPGSLGVVCWNKGQFCRYPSFGMNFVCSDFNGVWQLQGAAPTPRPTSRPVQDTCPGYWFIWGGLTRCNRSGRICRYPSWGKNYVCDNGFWQRQGPAPTPRPTPPPTNAATCPPSASYIRPGSFCTQTGQRCDYDRAAFECLPTGTWEPLAGR